MDFFISYAAQDRGWAEWIAWELEDAGYQVVIDAWDFTPGSNAVGEMNRAATTAARMLVVLSNVYLTSAYQEAEWQLAWLADPSAAGRRLLTARVEDCSRPGLLGRLVGVDLFGVPQDVAQRRLLTAAAGSRDKPVRRPTFVGRAGAAEPNRPAGFPGPVGSWEAVWQPGRSPFPGLDAFDATRAAVFKGREADTQRLVDSLRDRPAGRGELLVVVGPSGCGKSSLVGAGLVPTVAEDPDWLVTSPMVPGGQPLAALAGVLVDTRLRSGQRWSVSKLAALLDRPDVVTEVVRELLAVGQARRLLIVIDQAEEMLTPAVSAQARAQFLGVLAAAAAGPVSLVATLRSEYLDRLLVDTARAGLRVRTEALQPLARDLLPLVIAGPARLAGLDVEAELIAQMVADTGDGDGLPHLAYTLAQLYTQAQRTRTSALTGALYQAVGGVRGALVRHADTALAESVAATGSSEQQILANLLHLVHVDGEGRPTRRRVRLDDLPGSVRATMVPFVTGRLLTIDAVPGGPATVGVTHEALLSVWPALRTALVDHSDALRAARAVEQSALEWQRANRAEHYLWDADRLVAARVSLPAVDGADDDPGPIGLSLTAQAFIAETRRRVESARARRRRLVTRVISALSVLLVAALVATGLAVVQRHRAVDQRAQAVHQQTVATARGLVAQADQARSSDPLRALRMGLAAEKLDPTPETRAGLADTLAETPWIAGLEDDQAVSTVAFSPDSRTLATASWGDEKHGRWRLWDVADPHAPARLSSIDDDQDVAAVAFSPDGRTLATASGAEDQNQAAIGRLRLWDVTNPRSPVRLASIDDDQQMNAVVFSPDGLTVATATATATGAQTGAAATGRFRLWDVSNPRNPARLASIGDDQPGNAVAFSPDGRTLATGTSGQSEDAAAGRLRLWDVANPRAPTRLASVDDDGEVTAVAFSPDGHDLASTAWNDGVRLWSVTDGRSPVPAARIGAGTNMTAFAFSPDGRTIATTIGNSSGGNDGQFQLWDITDQQAPKPLANADDDQFLTAVAFSPDGRSIATSSFSLASGGRTRLRDTSGGHLRAAVFGIDDEPDPPDAAIRETTAVAFSPDGRTVASASADDSVGRDEGELQFWNGADRHKLVRLAGRRDEQTLYAVAFSPDGRVLASAGDRTRQGKNGPESAGGLVRLWAVGDPRKPALLATVDDDDQAVAGVAFSPDGRTLATVTYRLNIGGRLRLWDIANPRVPSLLVSIDDDQVMAGVAFSRNGRVLITVSGETVNGSSGSGGQLRLWDVTNPRAPRRTANIDDGQGFTAVAVSPDGHTIATTTDTEEPGDEVGGRLQIWDLTHPGRPTRLGSADDDQSFTAVTFSPDGRTIATTSSSENQGTDNTGGRLRLWDVTDPHVPARTASVDAKYSVLTAVFSPDGRTLVTSTDTGDGFSQLSLWDADWTVHLSGHIDSWACGAAGRGMTPQEWAGAAPGIAYQQTCP
ncbi:TIR domain-containing protein [Frankia sp. AgB1.9]|uniref:nSTAND1 domain-containing NTPase n=1 Tax=unclassified Frankia TaxID=2632575 RepID=UPI001EE4B9BF|nr:MULTISPECIES: TIR domain-containing protein [unclassified Frankia]MBL7487818.1 TIR domain-containing protein [Frankia sp. AgW1.1]MBL7547349.1 TIR domain-containing protein [Frankia sp. AgB1.9]